MFFASQTSVDPIDKRHRPADRIGAGRLERVVQVAAGAALLLTAGSWLGSKYWLLELLTHFRMQFVAAAAVLLAVAMVRRRPGGSFVALLVAAANAIPLLPFIMPGVMPGAIDAEAGQWAGQSSTRIMSANVRMRNNDHGALRAQIERESPDIVGLLEVDDAWIEGLSGLQAEYPHRVLRPEDGAYGLALYSRFPIRELETSPYIQDGTQTALSVEVELEDTHVTLTLAHLMAPVSAGRAGLRNLQIETISGMIRMDRGHEQIVIGDLNITPWSPFYAPLEKEAGLVNAARGRGYLPTWPAGFNVLKIPIDHMLSSDGVHVQRFRTGAETGSDHLPIIVDVAIPGARAGTST
jgi:endonuclease/exonuclease/phosphatase (EEP) superfamily protein YafD